MTTTATTSARWPTRITKIGLFAGLAAMVLLVIAGPGYRIGVLPLQPALLGAALGFLLFIMAFLIGGVGLLAGRVRSLHTSHATVAIVLLAGLATIFAGFWIARLRSAPPIHDITTDPEDPPAFEDIVPVRRTAGAVNAAEYQRTQRVGAREIDVIEAQRKAYPDVQPVVLPQAPARTLELAKQAAQAMGWDIVAASQHRRPFRRADRGNGQHLVLRFQGRRGHSCATRHEWQPRRYTISVPRGCW